MHLRKIGLTLAPAAKPNKNENKAKACFALLGFGNDSGVYLKRISWGLLAGV